jgi:hypothetical protein
MGAAGSSSEHLVVDIRAPVVQSSAPKSKFLSAKVRLPATIIPAWRGPPLYR